MANDEFLAWQAWRDRRHAELAAPDSWLGVEGLCWLSQGANPVGSAPEAAIFLDGERPTVGMIWLEGDRIFWRQSGDTRAMVDGVPMSGSGDSAEILHAVLHSDRDGPGSSVEIGHRRIVIIEREGRIGARVKNLQWRTRRPFVGVQGFPFDPQWVKPAKWERCAETMVIDVPTVTGDIKSVAVTHLASFEHTGRRFELLPMSASDKEVFFVFRDANSGKSCYGGGRFLRTSAPEDGQLQLDFNRAFNPPCAFTPFATCPLPPAKNWLDIPVDAGELRFVEAPEEIGKY